MHPGVTPAGKQTSARLRCNVRLMHQEQTLGYSITSARANKDERVHFGKENNSYAIFQVGP